MLRRKDIYVLLILMGALLGTLMGLNIFGLAGMVGYLTDIGFLGAWFIGWALAISVSARQLPDEEKRGTIISLLSKPVSRWDVVCGKWLGSWCVVSMANAGFYLLVIVTILLKGGRFDPTVLAEGFVLHCVSLGIIGAMVMLLSTRMNSDAATAMGWVLTLAAYMVVPSIPSYLSFETGWRNTAMQFLYHALPHLDVFDARVLMAHGLGGIQPGLLLCILAYGALLILVFLVLSWQGFKKKRFSRVDRL